MDAQDGCKREIDEEPNVAWLDSSLRSLLDGCVLERADRGALQLEIPATHHWCAVSPWCVTSEERARAVYPGLTGEGVPARGVL